MGRGGGLRRILKLRGTEITIHARVHMLKKPCAKMQEGSNSIQCEGHHKGMHNGRTDHSKKDMT